LETVLATLQLADCHSVCLSWHGAYGRTNNQILSSESDHYSHSWLRAFTLMIGKSLKTKINPLNAELNPICQLLVLLEAHHILHASRVRVNL